MILVDTSIWVDHLRKGNIVLSSLLERGEVAIHPFIIGELACGSMRKRDEILGLLKELPRVGVADHREVLHLVEAEHLHGQGIGWIDAHLLASARLSGALIWTSDKKLRSAAAGLGLATLAGPTQRMPDRLRAFRKSYTSAQS
jgi:predicted nucleic acid-binding protein